MGTTQLFEEWRCRVRRRQDRAVLAIILGVVLLVSACASGAEESSSVSNGSGEVSEQMAEGTATAMEDSEEVADTDIVRAPTEGGRLVRREASVVLEVDDLSEAIDEVSSAIVGGEGFLSNEFTNERSSTLTFEVPSEDFDQLLEGLPEFGELRSQQVTSEDRTEMIVDLESQLETAETSLERTRGFFDQAVTVEDLTRVEAELAQREATVASINAQLQNAQDGVALSSINVTLELADDQPVELDEEPNAGFFDALTSGFSAVANVSYTLLLVLAWLLPWTPFIIAGYFIVRWLRRGTVKRRAERGRKRAASQPFYPNYEAQTPDPSPVGESEQRPDPTVVSEPSAVDGAEQPDEVHFEETDDE